MDEKVDPIDFFKKRTDSLRLPASRVAALAGYHPYAVLPEIFLDLVYQGRIGHKLRVQDARDLGMQLVSADALLLELAKKAGADTAKALESAIQVKEGARKLENVKLAETIKKKVLEEAKKSKKLSSEEIKKLAEGSRSYVDTGFGTHHEDEALDLFEKQCGWEVRERNAEILNWPFAEAVSDSTELTANPMGPAKPREFIHRIKDGMKEGDQIPEVESTEKTISIANTHAGTQEEIIIDQAVSKIDTGNTKKQSKPFFIISGAVDGVRDELWCPPGQAVSDIDEEWQLRTVIVECKHRMRRAYNIPPLYDQIQTTIYCLMYDTDQADILQVMRKETKRERPTKRRKAISAEEVLAPDQKKIDEFLSAKEEPQPAESNDRTISSENKENEADLETEPSSSEPAEKDVALSNLEANKSHSEPPDIKPEQTIEIFVSRLSLHDQVMNHRQNWDSIILPRLRSFVDAVYRVRADDDFRKLFLEVVAREEESGYSTQVSWDILHQQCLWLKDCDTALHRIRN